MTQTQKQTAWVLTGACAVALCAGVFTSVNAQQGRGGRGGAAATNLFNAADANKDGFVTKDELCTGNFAKLCTDAGIS